VLQIKREKAKAKEKRITKQNIYALSHVFYGSEAVVM